VVVALGLRLVLVPFVRRRFADDPYRRYWSGKVASYAIVAVAVIAIVALWAPLGGRLSVILGFATAGIAFAMQEVIGALFGWVNILAGRIYTVGDRIEIAGVRGDVADITPQGSSIRLGQRPPTDRANGHGVKQEDLHRPRVQLLCAPGLDLGGGRALRATRRRLGSRGADPRRGDPPVRGCESRERPRWHSSGSATW
jgi:hypothetical protein